MYTILRNLKKKKKLDPISEFNNVSGFKVNTVGPPYWQVLHLWIQPTADGKYSEKKSRKFQKGILCFACQ